MWRTGCEMMSTLQQQLQQHIPVEVPPEVGNQVEQELDSEDPRKKYLDPIQSLVGFGGL